MFDAAEWLRGIEEAARLVDAEERWLEARRLMASRIGSPSTIGVHTGVSDPMAQVDSLLDAENERRGSMLYAYQEIEDARQVFAGMRSIGAMEHSAASMMELVHIGLSTKKDAAKALGLSYDTGKRAYSYGVDWLDAHGLAFAKAGRGLAE